MNNRQRLTKEQEHFFCEKANFEAKTSFAKFSVINLNLLRNKSNFLDLVLLEW